MNFRSREFDTLSLAYIYIEREKERGHCFVVGLFAPNKNKLTIEYIYTYIHTFVVG
jgi:hypothetical protein